MCPLAILADQNHPYEIDTFTIPNMAMGRPSDVSEWEQSGLMTPTNILQRLPGLR
jgi:hypothetical protein